MKVVVGIAVALLIALGVWLSLTLGNTAPPYTQPADTATTTSTAPAGWQAYSNTNMGIALQYPQGYTVDESYQYQNMGPGKSISGVKFTISPSIATGTNLASDSYVSVEQLPNATTCTADKFLDLSNGGKVKIYNNSASQEGGTMYSFASTTGAGAGNRYEEWVYALSGSNPCTAVRYMIHYGVLENYPAGTVEAFDKSALLDEFNKILGSLKLVQ